MAGDGCTNIAILLYLIGIALLHNMFFCAFADVTIIKTTYLLRIYSVSWCNKLRRGRMFRVGEGGFVILFAFTECFFLLVRPKNDLAPGSLENLTLRTFLMGFIMYSDT